MPHPRSDDLPELLLALATENAELRVQLGDAQNLLMETASDAGHLHARIEAVQIERDAWHAQAEQLQTHLGVIAECVPKRTLSRRASGFYEGRLLRPEADDLTRASYTDGLWRAGEGVAVNRHRLEFASRAGMSDEQVWLGSVRGDLRCAVLLDDAASPS